MDKLKQTPLPQEQMATSDLDTTAPGTVSPELPEDPLTIVGRLASRAVELNEAVQGRRYVRDKYGNVAAVGSPDHREMLDRDPDHAQ